MDSTIAALVLAAALASSTAAAAPTHLVRHGQTLGGIALQYRTTVRELVSANPRLKHRALRSGETLVIPGTGTAPGGRAGATSPVPKSPPEKGSRWSGKPKRAGVVHLSRLSAAEDAIVSVRERQGGVPMAALPVFARMLRSKRGATHAIDARLVSLVGVVSDHFAGRRLEVISGFRPYSTKQHTAHSNHNVGRALDFRVIGVPNEVVRDFCRTLRNVGVGYYPNSVFVHLDVRAAPSYWVDFSRPGEAPRYGDGGVDPDEGASDVSDDNPLVGKLGADDEDAPEKAPVRERGVVERPSEPPVAPVDAAPSPPVEDASDASAN